MTSTPVSYDVVKVSELELIGRDLNGNDELIVNDLLGSPVETKRCRVVDFANSIRQYVLPIASDTVLGGIKVGDGLDINPTTGVLSTTIQELGDLTDVRLTNVKYKEVIYYDGNEWVNTDASQAFVEMFGGDGIEITGKGSDTEVINVKPGQGITISNDQVTADLGNGVRIINDKIEAWLASPLYFESGAITFKTTPPVYVTPSGDLTLAYGVGLRLSTSDELECDPTYVVLKNSAGDIIHGGNITIDQDTLLRGNLVVRGNVTFGINCPDDTVTVNGKLITKAVKIDGTLEAGSLYGGSSSGTVVPDQAKALTSLSTSEQCGTSPKWTSIVNSVSVSNSGALKEINNKVTGNLSLDVAVDGSGGLQVGSNGLKIKNEGVVTGMIDNEAVTTSKIANEAVTNSKIADSAVSTNQLASSSVTSAKIAANAVGSSEIAAGAVGSSELAGNSVTAAKISSGAVGNSELANNSVTASKIAANAVGASEIAANAVGASEIASGAVGNSELANNSVDGSKLDNPIQSSSGYVFGVRHFGYVGKDGGNLVGSNTMRASRNDRGKQTITFTGNKPPNSSYTVIATSSDSEADHTVTVDNKGRDSFRIHQSDIQAGGESNSGLDEAGCNIIVIY